MSFALREYKGKAFLRKLGQSGFRAYVESREHPLQADFQRFFSMPETDYAQKCGEIEDLLTGSDNPAQKEDLTNLSLVNDLASEKGYLVMKDTCDAHDLSSLVTDRVTPHDLSMRLFIKHPDVFTEAHDMLEVDHREGWRLYLARDISEMADDLDDATAQFKALVSNTLRARKTGGRTHMDRYAPSGRVVLNIYHDGILTREQDFTQDGKIRITARNKISESSLVYHSGSGLLKVITPRGRDELNQFLYETFAKLFLKTPEALLKLKTGRIIVLDELLTRKEFPVDKQNGLDSANLTSLILKPYPGKASRVTLQDRAGNIPELVQKFSLLGISAEVIEAGIQFTFNGKCRQKTRTIFLKSRTNKVNLNNTPRDVIIENHLRRWGLLNG